MIIDIHSHVLPKMDDGSSSLEESIELLKMEAQQGIDRVAATPHFYARYDRPDTFLARRKEAEMRLREEMQKHDDLPELLIGAEVLFFHGISQSDAISDLTIGANRCILLEMDGVLWNNSVFQELEDICRDRQMTPIIAHVERYISPMRANKHLSRLLELPVLIQCNASFFLDRRTKRMALRMLKNGQVHLLGSDCHSVAHRPPRLGAAVDLIAKELGQDALDPIHAIEKKYFLD